MDERVVGQEVDRRGIPYKDEIMDIISGLSGKIGAADADEIASVADDVDKIRECFNALIVDRRWHKEEIAKANKRNFENQDINSKLARQLTVQQDEKEEDERNKEPDEVELFVSMFSD